MTKELEEQMMQTILTATPQSRAWGRQTAHHGYGDYYKKAIEATPEWVLGDVEKRHPVNVLLYEYLPETPSLWGHFPVEGADIGPNGSAFVNNRIGPYYWGVEIRDMAEQHPEEFIAAVKLATTLIDQ